MKSLNKFLLMSAVAVAGLFTACTDNDYEPGAPVDGMQIYFSNTIPAQYDVPDTESSVTIPVRRIESSEAAQVTILASDESGLFTIPSSVSFQAGSTSADLVITFDWNSLAEGTEYPISLLLTDQENTTPYGNYMVDFAIVPWPWTKLGTGKFRDDWFAAMWQNGGNPEVDVTIHEHKSKKGVYMVEEMFGWPYLTEFFGATQEQISSSTVTYTSTNITIDCSNPDQVVIPRQFTGITDLDPSYGEYEIAMYQDVYGTLKDGIITFPKESMAIVFGGDQALTTNKSGLFRIVLPGSEPTDYSLVAAYGGMRVGADNAETSLVLDFTYGADVTGISFVVATGDQTASVADVAAKIVDGTAENINEIKDFEVGGESVSVETPLAQSGIYTVVAVPADKTGKLLAEAASAASFYFPGLGGSEVPECEISLFMGSVSENEPESADKYPDISSLYFSVKSSNLRTISIALLSTRLYNSLVEAGATDEYVLANYGADYSDQVVPYINQTGEFSNIWQNLADDTSYTMVVGASNLYGKSSVESISASTKAITYPDYKGELAIGKYVMSYDAPLEGGGSVMLNNYFRIIPNNNSSTDFFVRDIAYELGLDWYAKYNASSNQLVLDGMWAGNESTPSYLGLWVKFSDTMACRFQSFDPANPESSGNDPIVIEIDPATKQPKALKTNLVVSTGDVVGNQVQSSTVVAIYAVDGTTFKPDVSQSSVVAPINTSRIHFVPFSSVSRDSSVRTLQSSSRMAIAEGIAPYAGLRTLKMNVKKCEPLPKQVGGRAKIDKQNIRLLN